MRNFRVKFCNVGQGDSIIVHWEEGSTHYLGIVDCKDTTPKVNPVIDYLDGLANVSYEIVFLVFTHMHADHFSGSAILLDYLLKRRKKVKYYFTSDAYDTRLMIYNISERLGEMFKEYLKVLKLFSDRKGANLVEEMHNSSRGFEKELVPEILRIRFCSPSKFETDEFTKNMTKESNDGFRNGSQAANFLAPVIFLQSRNRYIILSSDAENVVFDKSLNNYIIAPEQCKLVMAQIPHHGAKSNFSEVFWLARCRIDNCPAIISVGKNCYQHPSIEVMEQLQRSGYRVEATNEVGNVVAFREKFEASEVDRILALDTIGSELQLYESAGITVELPRFFD